MPMRRLADWSQASALWARLSRTNNALADELIALGELASSGDASYDAALKLAASSPHAAVRSSATRSTLSHRTFFFSGL